MYEPLRPIQCIAWVSEPAIADEPTIGAIRGNEFLYVANGPWDKQASDGTVLKGARLTRPIILALPIPKQTLSIKSRLTPVRFLWDAPIVVARTLGPRDCTGPQNHWALTGVK